MVLHVAWLGKFSFKEMWEIFTGNGVELQYQTQSIGKSGAISEK